MATMAGTYDFDDLESKTDAELLDLIRNTSYGDTQPEGIWNHRPAGEIVWKVLLFLPIVLVGLVGNFLIVYVIYKFKQTRNCTNLFICNMAIADFLATLLVTWAALASNQTIFQNYVLGLFYCRFEGFTKVTCLLASVLSLTTISCDRLLGIVRPFSRRLTSREAYSVVAIIWLSSLALSTPLIFWRKLLVREWIDFTEISCEESQKLRPYWLWLLALMVYIPLIFMFVAYAVIISRLRKYEDRLGDRGNPVKVKYRRQIIKMLFIYVANFFICWLPLQILVLYRFFSDSGGPKPAWYLSAVFVGHVFASLNNAINPIIYGVLNETFRKAICLLFPKLLCILRLPPTVPTDQRTQRPSARNVQNSAPPLPGVYDQNIVGTSFAISDRARQTSSLFNISGKHIKMNRFGRN